jgi:hypothetical protein
VPSQQHDPRCMWPLYHEADTCSSQQVHMCLPLLGNVFTANPSAQAKGKPAGPLLTCAHSG